MSRSLLLIGHGRMGRLVEAVAPEYGFEVAGRIGREESKNPDAWPRADVAVDFSIGEAVPINLPQLAARGINVVVGATGWQDHESALRARLEHSGIGIVAAPNFAVGVNLFTALAERAAELWKGESSFGAWIHELHHSKKRDAPSGTALALEAGMRRSGYTQPIDMSSTRAGHIPGTHTIGFDAAAETITLTHTARDRTVFARGALHAAAWVEGKRGWFTMRDVLGIG